MANDRLINHTQGEEIIQKLEDIAEAINPSELIDRVDTLEDEVDDIFSLYGAKNLIPCPYYRASGYTSGNMTATYDEDGVITINKTSDTATRYFTLFFGDASSFLLPNKRYILSMELENASNTSVFCKYTSDISDRASIANKATGKYETVFETPNFNDDFQLGLYYGANATETNAKVKVMLRPASIEDSTYEPYAKTNKQLTDDTANKNDLASINITSGTTNNTGFTIPSGTYFYYNGAYVKAKADIANGATLTFNTNFESANVGDDLTAVNSALNNIFPSNYVKVSANVANSALEIRVGTDSQNYMDLYVVQGGIFFQKIVNGTTTTIWQK